MDITVRIADKFKSCIGTFGPSSRIIEKWSTYMIQRYTEPQRYYHTLSHVESMLKCLQVHKIHINNVSSLELAIFFHDCVYDPESKTNELHSMKEFERFIIDVPIPVDQQNAVKAMIEATIAHKLPENEGAFDQNDLRMFLDFDLEVLGRSWEEYYDYSRQIRKEYQNFNDSEYQTGRTKVLESFLQRDRLYFSHIFHEEFERKARANIDKELKILREVQSFQ